MSCLFSVDTYISEPAGTDGKNSNSTFHKVGPEIIEYLTMDKACPKNKVLYYQRDAVLSIKELFQQDSQENTNENLKNPALIVAPTGAGKSGIIVLLPYVLRANKVLLVTPSKVISEQMAKAFGNVCGGKSFFETSGLIRELHKLQSYIPTIQIINRADEMLSGGPRSDLVIVNAQKFSGQSKTSLHQTDDQIVRENLQRVREFLSHFDLLVVDEAHHYPAETWGNIVKEFSKSGTDKKIVFLTATPYRQVTGKREAFILGQGPDIRKRIAYEITNHDTCRGKATRPCVFKEKTTNVDPETVTQDLMRILRKQERREDRFQPQAMVLVRTKLEASYWSEEMNRIVCDNHFAVAITSGAQSQPSPNLLEEDKRNFDTGMYRVAVICKLLLEGYDNQHVTTCVILRKVRSRVLFTQFIGRCMRMMRFPNREPDRTTATVLTYQEFNQRALWDAWERDEGRESDEIILEDVMKNVITKFNVWNKNRQKLSWRKVVAGVWFTSLFCLFPIPTF